MRRLIPILILLALAFAACQLAGDGKEENTFSFDALYDSLKVYDKVEIYVGDTAHAEKRRIFEGKVENKAQLRGIAAGDYKGGIILILIVGHKDGAVVYEEEKIYDGDQKKTVDRRPMRTLSSAVTLDVDALRMAEGDTLGLPLPKVEPATLFDKEVVWSSSETGVAIVESGKAIARAQGSTQLSAKLKSDPAKQATLTLRVDRNPLLPVAITVEPETLVVAYKGRRQRLKARISPASAATAVDWVVEDPERAEADTLGDVTGKSVGLTGVKAVSRRYPAKSGQGWIKVIETVPVRAVRFLDDSIGIYVGGAEDSLRVSVEPYLADPTLEFEMASGGYASYQDGRLKGEKPGRTSIKAMARSDRSISDDLIVIVHPRQQVDSVTLVAPTKTLIWHGDTIPLKAKVHGTSVSDKVVWKSSEPAKVSVDSTGRIAPGDVGTALITATSLADGTKSASIEISVRRDMPQAFLGRDTTVQPGSTVEFKPQVTQTYGLITAFKWDFDGNGTWEGESAPEKAVSHRYADTGVFVAAFYFRDSEGNDTIATRKVTVRESPLNLSIVFPGRDTLVNTSPFTIRFTVNGSLLSSERHLRNGLNVVRIDTANSQGQASDSIEITLDSIPPKVRINSPKAGFATRNRQIAVAWTADSLVQDSLKSEDLGTVDGEKTIRRYALDKAGNRGGDSLKVILDTKPPKVVIESPADGFRTSDSLIPVQWTVDDARQTSDTTQSLNSGDNRIIRRGTDAAGNVDSMVISVYRRTEGPDVQILSPKQGDITNKDTAHVRWSVDGVEQPVHVETLTAEGDIEIKRTFDTLGLHGEAKVTIVRDIKNPNRPTVSAPIRLITTVQNSAAGLEWTWTSGSDNGAAGMHSPPMFIVQRSGGLPDTVVRDRFYRVANPGDGAYNIHVRELDKAGNQSSWTDSVWITVDKTPPAQVEVVAASPSSAPSWSWAGKGGGNGRFHYRMDGGAWSSETSATRYFPHAVSDGDHFLDVEERDENGNWSTTVRTTVVMDRALPSVTPTLLACGEAGAVDDTVVAEPDDQGFRPIFDGTSFKGWWQSCLSAHSGPAYWTVDPDHKAFMTTQNGTKGGLLLTNKPYLNYELIFDIWPKFGNDAGIFNRTTPQGKCMQTTLDYIGGASMGGAWGEGGFTGRDYRPFSFRNQADSINIPGNSGGTLSNWTAITSTMSPTTFGCSSGGCIKEDWPKIWNIDGWNQVRIKVFGSGLTAQDPMTIHSWVRRFGAQAWTPILFHSIVAEAGANPIGINTHAGGRFGGGANWYRNIRVRQLDATGNPVP